MTTIDQSELTKEEVRAIKRQERIDGVRDMLTFLEENPSVPIPYFASLTAYAYDNEVNAVDIARLMKPVTKDYSTSYFQLKKNFGDQVQLSIAWSRDAVCEKKVIGTKHVKAQLIEAYDIEEVEWSCPDSLLKDDEE